MNILVCIKQVPGTNRVEVDEKTGVLKRDGVDSKMNPYDLYALETALRLKEAHGGKVIVISMGPPQARQIIQEAYAMGADEGILLSDRRFGGADVLATGYALAQGILLAGNFDLILCGKQTTDGDTAQVGPEIAENLGIPSLSNVKRILEAGAGFLTAETDLGHSVQTAKVTLPCLVTVEKDIFQPRLPSYVRKTQTAQRPIRVLTLDDLTDNDENRYGLNGSPTQVRRIFPPESGSARELWQGKPEELADKFAEKLKALKFL